MDWQLLLLNKWFVVFTILWTLPWKGVALWKAAKKGEKYWFVAMLIVNSYGLIEIMYIFVFAKTSVREKIGMKIKTLQEFVTGKFKAYKK